MPKAADDMNFVEDDCIKCGEVNDPDDKPAKALVSPGRLHRVFRVGFGGYIDLLLCIFAISYCSLGEEEVQKMTFGLCRVEDIHNKFAAFSSSHRFLSIPTEAGQQKQPIRQKTDHYRN